MEIPGFKIERLIAEGGMASVYLAVQSSLNRQVAIKVLKKFDRPDQAKRFLEEGRIIASLNHHNIITIHDIGVVGDRHYIAMEYLEGGTLGERIAAGMPMDAVILVMESIGDCLDFVHRRGIVHRDIKPANVLFHADGTPKLTDFGIAKQLDKNQGLTLDGTTLGSPHYLSPEQAGGRSLDGRSDLYSLGVVFYEMLTGRKPFSGDSSVETIIAHLTHPIPVLPEPMARFQDLLERMLAKDPDDRIASAHEMIERLRALRTAPHSGRIRPGGVTAEDSRPPLGRRSRPSVPLIIGSGLALLMLVASAILLTRQRASEPVSAPKSAAADGEAGPLREPALPLSATTAAAVSRLSADGGPNPEPRAATSETAEISLDYAAADLSRTQAFAPEAAPAKADETPPVPSPAAVASDGQAAAFSWVEDLAVLGDMADGGLDLGDLFPPQEGGAREEGVAHIQDESAGGSTGGETAALQSEDETSGPLLPPGEQAMAAEAARASAEGRPRGWSTAVDEADEMPIASSTSSEEGAAAVWEDPATIDSFEGPGSPSDPFVQTTTRDLDEQPAQSRTIEEWLRAADQALIKYRLTTPPGDNAYAYYQEVLAIDPAHAAAHAGLDKIAGLYDALARKELRQGDHAAASLYVKRGLDVQSDHAGLRALQARLAQAPKAKRAPAAKERAPRRADRNPVENIRRGVEKGLDRLRSLVD